MRSWNIPACPPLALNLAADARLIATDYINDHIWELTFGSGEPPSLAIQTTFGLRARSFRLFWRFSEAGNTVTDPASFAAPPVLQAFYPNYARLAFEPFPDVTVVAEYWACSSHVLAGRLRLTNRTAADREFDVELAANLVPNPDGKRMTPVEMGAATVLAGETGGLCPLVFLTGGPQAGVGAYPSLTLHVTAVSRQTYSLVWVQTAQPTADEAFQLARATAASEWDAELARIELANASMFEIHTGSADWDFALALSQSVALGLLMSAPDQFTAPSFVLSRQPDQGHSPRGDGSDYPFPWSGQTPLDAYYLFGQILPGCASIAKGIVRNFLATQTENGFMDWKPGLGGQRSQIWATPLLATLVEHIYQTEGDPAFLEEVFPHLLAFIQAWFSQHDRDGDGIPEWDHPAQTGFDEHPIFSRWHPWSQGVDISSAESPDLCAYLYRECQALVRIANILSRKEAITSTQALTEHIKTAVETSWDQQAACYRYWDRDSHRTTRRETLGARLGSGDIAIRREFADPVRLLIRVAAQTERSRAITLFIYGTGVSGQHRVERIGPEQFNWFLQEGVLTGERIYTQLDRIEIQEIGEADQVIIQTAGYEVLDHTLLTPLWARIPTPGRAQSLVQKTLLAPDGFGGPYGLRACPNPPESDELSLKSIHFLWNLLAGEGLLAYGFRSEALDLVSRLMEVSIQALKRDGVFRRFYRADTGLGSGERNALGGLPPVGLFLQTLGVQIHSPRQVALDGFNPFPWPVTVKYRGLTVLCQKEKTTVIFPDGQMVVVDDPSACTVSLEE